jgi:ATP-binding cassette subfamily B protein
MRYVTKQTFSIFLQHARAYPWALFCTIFFIVVGDIFSIITPLWYKKFFDILLLEDAVAQDLVQILFVIFGFALLHWMSISISRVTNAYFQTNVMRDLSNTAFQYVHRHSVTFFDNTFVGSLVKKVNRFAHAFEGVADRLIWDLLPIIINIGGILIVLGTMSMWFVVALVAWLIVYCAGNYYFSQFKLRYDVTRTMLESSTSGLLADTISNQTNVKFFNGFRREFDGFLDETRKLQKIQRFTWDLATLSETVQWLLMIVLEILVMYIAILLWQDGNLTVGDFVLIQAYLIRVFEKIWGFGRVIRHFYEHLADAEEMTQILKTPHAIVDSPRAVSLVVSEGDITFSDVTFEYNSTRTVLKHFDVHITGGERIALVGHSGAGKSTISKLLLRMHDVSDGRIVIDRQNIQHVTLESLWQHISYVPQDPILFHRTLMENIRYGRPEATDEEVITAAQQAHAHEFIIDCTDGYGTLVGERGIKLSGGERQRIAIARAILKNAPILILDEATASLDSESEMYIQDALDVLMKGKTVVVIAHRLSTIMKMDRIIVMHEGQVIEQGTHKQLLRKKTGRYKKLWDLQAGEFIRDT